MKSSHSSLFPLVSGRNKVLLLSFALIAIKATCSKSAFVTNSEEHVQSDTKHLINKDFLMDKSQIRGNIQISRQFSSTNEKTSRSLQGYSAVNDLLNDVAIFIPDIELEENVGGFFGNVKINVRDFFCNNIRIDNVSVSHVGLNKNRVDSTVQVTGMNVQCQFKWEYDIGFRGSGSGTIVTSQNSISETFSVVSEDYNAFPPNDIFSLFCDSNVNVERMDIQGLSGFFASLLRDIFSDVVTLTIEEGVCSGASSAVGQLEPIMNDVSNVLNTYAYGELSEELSDPLSGEKSFSLENDLKLIDFKNEEFMENNEVIAALNEIMDWFGTRNRISPFPLGIATALRNNILDENKQLVYTSEALKMKNGGVLFEDSSDLLAVTVKVKSFTFEGLDSISNFDFKDIISSQTLRGRISWDFLKVNIAFQLEVLLDKTLLKNEPSSEFNRLVEDFNIIVTAENVDLIASLFIAIDDNKFNNLQVGSILGTEHLIPCFLSTIQSAEMTEVKLTSLDYMKPVVKNFSSASMTMTASSVNDAFHTMYSKTIEKAEAYFFAHDVQPLFSKIIADYLFDASNSICPVFVTTAPSQALTITPSSSPTVQESASPSMSTTTNVTTLNPTNSPSVSSTVNETIAPTPSPTLNSTFATSDIVFNTTVEPTSNLTLNSTSTSLDIVFKVNTTLEPTSNEFNTTVEPTSSPTAVLSSNPTLTTTVPTTNSTEGSRL